MSELPIVSVTVVLYRCEDTIGACLRSLPESDAVQILAVDNASPDSSRRLIEREFPTIEIVPSGANLGFAGGCNLSWPKVRGRYWLLLNPDAAFEPGAFDRLVAWMDEHPDVGVGSPSVVDAVGLSQFPARRFPSPLRVLFETSRLHKLLPKRTRSRLLLGPYWDRGDSIDADWVPGTAMILRRKVIEETGPLSEDFVMYGEDLEVCTRARRAGWKVGVCSSATLWHLGSRSADAEWGEDGRNRRVLAGYYGAVQRLRGRAYAWALRAAHVIADAVESCNPRLAAAQRRRLRASLLGHLGVRLAPERKLAT